MNPLLAAFLAALLFGASTPASKALLADLGPWQLAGLLYLGAALGVGPFLWRERRAGCSARVDLRNRVKLAATVFFGGVAGPVLLMFGLKFASSSSVALLLNLEMATTAVLGVMFFREHLGRLGWMGVVATIAAGVLLSGNGGTPELLAAILTACACIAWAIDNQLTAVIDGISPVGMTFWKGLVAGSVNLAIGLALAPLEVSWFVLAAALVVGALCYGCSIGLYIAAAQRMGATRAQSVFASAPFLGASLSFVLLGEPLGWRHLAAGGALIVGVVLLLRDRHEHVHDHGRLEHAHAHSHDDGHHAHEYPEGTAAKHHSHAHAHESSRHSHRHVSDLHHRHEHREDGREP